ncbi:Predicted O-methyltransferase YrrM [Paenibacillus sp. cl141a]|uniref:O-methyltransferase n=1 Tax=Paenibacillus sp. cl141a TaxID=1761877 RepID=UPI0008AC7671|nr:O-methyltransferase [Paenibacillus sp. cl141a]SEK98930.1 Predicted O-methyltransferase YrrM [Paenibacillus sp. cl141a]
MKANANDAATWGKVDDYVTEHLIPYDEVLEKVLAANREAGLPEIDVSPAQGKLLNVIVQIKGAKRILEIGTLGGYSTIWMARAIGAEGRLISLELDPHHAKVAKSNVALAGLEDRVSIRVGDALAQLEQLAKEKAEPFDLIFIDADKPNNPNYLKWALQFSKAGTVIISDNVIRNGEVIDYHSTDPRVHGIRKFMDMLSADSSIAGTAIQTVGSKGYDGFYIGIVQ